MNDMKNILLSMGKDNPQFESLIQDLFVKMQT